jgi:hypothetical protein
MTGEAVLHVEANGVVLAASDGQPSRLMTTLPPLPLGALGR